MLDDYQLWVPVCTGHLGECVGSCQGISLVSLKNAESRVEIFPMSWKQHMQMECGRLLELVTRAIGSSPSLPFLRDIECAYSILPRKLTNAQFLCKLVYLISYRKEKKKTMDILMVESPWEGDGRCGNRGGESHRHHKVKTPSLVGGKWYPVVDRQAGGTRDQRQGILTKLTREWFSRVNVTYRRNSFNLYIEVDVPKSNTTRPLDTYVWVACE